MKLYLSVLTSRPDLLDGAGALKSSIFPAKSLKGGYKLHKSEHIVNIFDCAGLSAPHLVDELHERSSSSDRLLVLYESQQGFLLNEVRGAFLGCSFETDLITPISKNYMASRVAKLLKAVRILDDLFHDHGNAALLSLPMRNFSAPDFEEIFELATDVSRHANFYEEVNTRLQKLRRRVRPRSNSNYRTKYTIDDEQKFFVYGHERHSRHATGGDHTQACDLRARFRFGCALDAGRHYNVSLGEKDLTSISGNFHFCHGAKSNVQKRTHLNMFSNDYFC